MKSFSTEVLLNISNFFLNSRTLPKFELAVVKVLTRTVISLKLFFQYWGEILCVPLDNYLPKLYFTIAAY